MGGRIQAYRVGASRNDPRARRFEKIHVYIFHSKAVDHDYRLSCVARVAASCFSAALKETKKSPSPTGLARFAHAERKRSLLGLGRGEEAIKLSTSWQRTAALYAVAVWDVNVDTSDGVRSGRRSWSSASLN